jgi:hypothetical protein
MEDRFGGSSACGGVRRATFILPEPYICFRGNTESEPCTGWPVLQPRSGVCAFHRARPRVRGSRNGTAEWLERERVYLLPVPNAHVVLTLPQTLCPLVLQNPQVCYGLLFRAAAETLL